MGICPDCGGWIDEGDCSCSCGSTRYMDNDYGGDEGDYFNSSSTSYMPQINYKLIERLKKQWESKKKGIRWNGKERKGKRD